MNHTRTEILVGLFVRLASPAWVILPSGSESWNCSAPRGMCFYADFPSVAGLKAGDPVEIAGVRSAAWSSSAYRKMITPV